MVHSQQSKLENNGPRRKTKKQTLNLNQSPEPTFLTNRKKKTNKARKAKLKQTPTAATMSTSNMTELPVGGRGTAALPTETSNPVEDFELLIPLPKKFVGQVIGTGGARIKMLRERTNTKISAKDTSPGISTLLVRGRRVDCQKARAEVEKMFLQFSNAKDPVEMKHCVSLSIPTEKLCHVIGAQGAKMKKLQEQWRVLLVIHNDPSNSRDEAGAPKQAAARSKKQSKTIIVLVGGAPARLQQCKQVIINICKRVSEFQAKEAKKKQPKANPKSKPTRPKKKGATTTKTLVKRPTPSRTNRTTLIY